MAQGDETLQLIEQYLSTKRRIRDIERKAMKKLGSPVPDGPTCSFCGASAQDVQLLIPNQGTARICSECIVQISTIINAPDAR